MKPNLLKMKEIALIYLDRSGGLQKFVDDCKLYNSGNIKILLKGYSYLVWTGIWGMIMLVAFRSYRFKTKLCCISVSDISKSSWYYWIGCCVWELCSTWTCKGHPNISVCKESHTFWSNIAQLLQIIFFLTKWIWIWIIGMFYSC